MTINSHSINDTKKKNDYGGIFIVISKKYSILMIFKLHYNVFKTNDEKKCI